MKCNVGKTDKVIRIVLGVVIAVLGVKYQSYWGLLAVVPFATALFGFCPLYSLLGVSTCKVEAPTDGGQQQN